jgi:hypothetical protein
MPESTRRVLVSVELFQPSKELLSELREYRQVNGADDLMKTYDAFMLDPGLGPAIYLSSDGRIVWDDDGWGVLGTRADALAAIRAGVNKTGVQRLLALLPSRESGSIDCPNCDATGRFDAHGQLRDVSGQRFSIVCVTCAGLGWTAPSVVLTESVLETVSIAGRRRQSSLNDT